jgi:hypothetical protein
MHGERERRLGLAVSFPAALSLPYDGPMSDDEVAVAVVSTFVALVTTGIWISALRARGNVFGPTPWKRALQWAPLQATALVLLVLRMSAASDVRDDARYLYLYTAWGAAWIGVAMLWLPLFGLSARDDVVERRNSAAGLALCSLPFAFGLAYVGGNIGDGPGWWVVLASSGLATAASWLLIWLALSPGRAHESITIERDVASALRFGGLIVAEAAVLGRAVAGDWQGAEGLLRDFAVRGWPALALAFVALVLERPLRPNAATPRRSTLAAGFLPALAYVAAALVWILQLGSLA